MQELKERLAMMQRPPDLVITDHRLPDGWTAENIIDAMSAHFEVELPAIIVTGEVTTDLAECAGAQLLVKPVAPEVLLAAIAASGQRPPEMAPRVA